MHGVDNDLERTMGGTGRLDDSVQASPIGPHQIRCVELVHANRRGDTHELIDCLREAL